MGCQTGYLIVVICLLAFACCQSNVDNLLVPLTNLRNVRDCLNSPTRLTVQCELGSRIRILESFYGVSNDKASCEPRENSCRSPIDTQTLCNGNRTCDLHLNKGFLVACGSEADLFSISYECIPDNKVHDICTFTENYDTWGTLQTHYGNKYANDVKKKDCWCTLGTAQFNQRIILSVITFDYTPGDTKCVDIGFYLRADSKQDPECTVLRKDRYYISSTNNLYLNFRPNGTKTNRQFWIIYEGSDNQAKVQLKCGHTRETQIFKTFSDKLTVKLNLSEILNSKSLQMLQNASYVINEASTKSPSQNLSTNNFTDESRRSSPIRLKIGNITAVIQPAMYEVTSGGNLSQLKMMETSTVSYLLSNTSSENNNDKNIGNTGLIVVVVCAVFILILALSNLVTYVFRKLVTESNRESKMPSVLDMNRKDSLYPSSGEVVLWADQDRHGYLIDTNGTWAKIDAQRWVTENMKDTYKKASLAYRKRFWKRAEKSVMTRGDKYLITNDDFDEDFILPTVPEVSENGSTSTSDGESKKSHAPSQQEISSMHVRPYGLDVLKPSIKVDGNSKSNVQNHLSHSNKTHECFVKKSSFEMPPHVQPNEIPRQMEITSFHENLPIVYHTQTAESNKIKSANNNCLDTTVTEDHLELVEVRKIPVNTLSKTLVLNSCGLVMYHNAPNKLLKSIESPNHIYSNQIETNCCLSDYQNSQTDNRLSIQYTKEIGVQNDERDKFPMNSSFFLTDSPINASDIAKGKNQSDISASQKLQNFETMLKNYDKVDPDRCKSNIRHTNHSEINSNILRFRSEALPILRPDETQGQVKSDRFEAKSEKKQPWHLKTDDEFSDAYNSIKSERFIQNCEFFKPSYETRHVNKDKLEGSYQENAYPNPTGSFDQLKKAHKFDANFSLRPSINDNDTSTMASSKSMLSEARAKLEILNSKKWTDSSSFLYDLLDTYDVTQQTQF